ncbi:hypothetical protein BDP27DRAFT_854289 [Rhodocollybia butyracea]|uniref:RRM domain-containing protein n=1 Tax=Rhodocollybia butyracea TaxID=206335 RepID=A0A9P5PRK9_9AGAR|nr:hypothetical protein BDP27DRAFT_854289 [Rhodocollybia butyracea]
MIARTRDIGRGEIGNRLNIDLRSLYVKNLPPEIDERALEERFGEFGHINRVGIKRSAAGGFGFIQYRTGDSGAEAIKKMHDSIVVVQGKASRLYVGVRIPKQLLQEISDVPEPANSNLDPFITL